MRPADYSDVAIEVVLSPRVVFNLALRHAEAFAGSILRLLGSIVRSGPLHPQSA